MEQETNVFIKPAGTIELLKAEAAAAAQGKSASVMGVLVNHIETLVASLETRGSNKQVEKLGIHLEDGLEYEEMGETQEEEENDHEEDQRRNPVRSNLAMLTSIELSKLQCEISKANGRDPHALSKIPLSLLKTILNHLDSHVSNSTQGWFSLEKGIEAIKKGNAEAWLSSGEGKRLHQNLKDALLAAEVMMSFFTAPGINRTIIAEEPIEHCCSVLKYVLQGMLVPVFQLNAESQSIEGTRAKATSSRNSLSAAAATMDETNDDDRNSEDNDEITRSMARPLSRAILQLCESGGVLPLMEKLELLARNIRLDDRLILTLVTTCLSTLPIQCEAADISRLIPLHHHALGLLIAIFSSYEHHRVPIIDDLFPIMLKLPTTKKFHRLFKLNILSKRIDGSGETTQDSIQTVSGLIMLLVQSCVGDQPKENPKVGITSDVPVSPSKLTSSGKLFGPLRDSYRMSSYLVKSFLQRCQKKDESAEYRPLLTSFVEDMLASCLLPDWPAAETMLQALTHALTKDLTLYSSSSKDDDFGDAVEASTPRNSSAAAAVNAGGSQYVSLALELLGRICTRLREVVRLDREFPLVFPDAVKLSDEASASPDGDDQTIGCPCGISVNTGGFMLDCDRCHRWFHGICVSINADSPPSEWFCEDCRITLLLGKQRDELDRKRNLNKRLSSFTRSSIHLSSPVKSCPISELEKEEESEAEEIEENLSLGRKKRKSKSASKTTKRKKAEVIAEPESPVRMEEVEANVEEKDIFRQLLLNYLNERALSEPWMLTARRYHLAHWLQDYEESDHTDKQHACSIKEGDDYDRHEVITTAAVQEHFTDQWDLVEDMKKSKFRKDEWDEVSLNATGTARIQRSLIVKGTFVAQFDQLLVSLLQLLGSSVPTLRAKVVKAVASIVDADPLLMTNEHVRTAIIQRFYDASISVRQAAVDLVGRYALLTPELFEQYHEALCERLVDRGVSVRKSVVKILRDALLAHPDYTQRSSICQLLVHRASSPKEEDSIKDLIRRTFEQLWFNEREVESGSDEVYQVPSSSLTSTTSKVTPSDKSAFEFGSPNLLPIEESVSSANVLPAGWRTEKSTAGTCFISPTGHKCFSLEEAIQISHHEQQRLAPPRSSTKKPSKSGLSSNNVDMAELRLRASAAQMVEVVHGVSNTEWLVELLKGMLFGAGEGNRGKKEEKKRREFVASRCEALVNCCVDFLLFVDEENDNLIPFKLSSKPKPKQNPVPGGAAATNSESAEIRAQALVACITTLHVFCKASPNLLVNHVETFIPYLQADNHVEKHYEEIICGYVANMVTWALPLTPEHKRDHKVLKNTADYLMKLTYKFGQNVVHASVECLAVLTSSSSDPSSASSPLTSDPMMTLAKLFYKVLLSNISKDVIMRKDMANVQRGLVVLGAICRYRKDGKFCDTLEDDVNDGAEEGDDNDDDDTHSNRPPIKPTNQLDAELTEANIRSNCFQIFVGYLTNTNELIAQNALRGLSSQLIGSPRLMLVANRSGLVSQVLNHPSSLLRLEALISWREILEAEEHRIESGQAREEMISRLGIEEEVCLHNNQVSNDGSGDGVSFESVLHQETSEGIDFQELSTLSKMALSNKQVQGDQDGESSVVGGVLQMHYRNILTLLFDKSKHGLKIRIASSKLLGVFLRQGLVNPLAVMPYVIALLGEVSSLEIRNDALRLLLVEDEKYPDFLNQRMLAGIALAYTLQKTVLGQVTALVSDSKDSDVLTSIFSGVYSQCIRSNRKKRQSVLKGILNLFEQPTKSKEMKQWLEVKSLNGSDDMEEEEEALDNGGKKNRSKGKKADEALDLGFLAFACETLCYLPYDVQEEPLYIIYQISRFISYQGSTLLENFRAELKGTGMEVVDSDDEDEDKMVAEQQEESTSTTTSQKKQASSKAQSSNRAASPLLKKYALESFSATLLLYTKHFLKNLYKLSNTRCHDYAPTESTKASEKSIFLPDEIPLLNLPDAGLLQDPSHVLTVSEASNIFHQFNLLMKGDPNSDFRIAPTKARNTSGSKKKSLSGEAATIAGGGVDSLSTLSKKRSTPSASAKKKKRKVSKKKKVGEDDSDNDDGDDSDYGG